MLEVSLFVERGSQVSVGFPDPVCHHVACRLWLGDWQRGWLFQCRSLPRGQEVSC